MVKDEKLKQFISNTEGKLYDMVTERLLFMKIPYRQFNPDSSQLLEMFLINYGDILSKTGVKNISSFIIVIVMLSRGEKV